jgi:hypothetical protein
MSESHEGEIKTVEGYLILNDKSDYLTGGYFWYEHDKPEDARVFTRDQVEDIMKLSKTEEWKGRVPVKIIPASWDGSNVTVSGEPADITKLPEKTN